MDKVTTDKHIKIINGMSQEEMARMWRFTPAGHAYFDSTEPISKYFDQRFKELGGMTSCISKKIGWEAPR